MANYPPGCCGQIRKAVIYQKICLECSVDFSATKETRKYCSHKCYTKHQSNLDNQGRFRSGYKSNNNLHPDLPRNNHKTPLIPCNICSETLVSIYGSGHCAACAYKLKLKTELRIHKTGYAFLDNGNRPKPVHIQKAEKALRRSLNTNEIVHHVNLHKDDNRNSNLVICSRGYHTWLHYAYQRQFAAQFDYVPGGI